MTVRGIDGRATHFLGQVIIEDSNPDTASIFAAIAPLPGGCIIIIDPPVDPRERRTGHAPETGFDPILLLLPAAGLIAGGLALRRRQSAV